MGGWSAHGHYDGDLATQGRRHPGSAFKMVVLATALEQGRAITSTVDGSGPRESAWEPRQEPYRVRNFGGASHGHLTFHEALVRSANTAFVQLALETGISDVVEQDGRFGIDVDGAFGSHRGPAVAIGGLTHGVTPWRWPRPPGCSPPVGSAPSPT